MTALYHGGGLDAAVAKFGGEPSDWLDLSTGINPVSWPIPELSVDSWKRLPDRSLTENLYRSARAYYQVPERAAIVAANGTQALIQLLPQVLDAQSVAILSPTYAEHEYCWRGAGKSPLLKGSLENAVGEADVVVVGNPNNPDGRETPAKTLRLVADRLAEKSGYLIVDEAFCDVRPELSLIPDLPENALVLRSFGKFFGLAGARLGFAIASHKLVSQISSRIGPWAVSGPALEIGGLALADHQWIENARAEIYEKAEALVAVLNDGGLKVSGNAGLFIDTYHNQAFRMFEHLANHHILVRPFVNRPNHLRFGLPNNHHDFERLTVALKSCVG